MCVYVNQSINQFTVKLLIQAGSQIQAGYPVEAGCHLMTIKDVIAAILAK